MFKHFLLFSILLLGFKGYTQILFEEGYYIDNSDRRVDCLIKFADWKNNPAGFDYRLTPDGEIKRALVADVSEFGVRNVIKYIRGTVDLDRSSDEVGKLTTDRNPVFTKEELFLKVLVEGEASLYSYTEGNLMRFFFRKGNGRTEALVYKLYKIDGNRVAKNNFYRKQLLDDLGCGPATESDVKNLRYKSNDLVRIFTRYNSQCGGSEPILYGEKKTRRDLFNLSARPRINRSSFSIHNNAGFLTFDAVDYNNKLDFGLGIDAEIVMPFFRNKWAIAVEPTFYKGFKAAKEVEGIDFMKDRELIMEVSLRSWELPVGVRYYMFLNERSKISVNAYYMLDFGSGSKVDFSGPRSTFYKGIKLTPQPTFILGLGYKFNNKFGLEARYYLERDLTGSYLYWHSDYNTVSLTLGISLF